MPAQALGMGLLCPIPTYLGDNRDKQGPMSTLPAGWGMPRSQRHLAGHQVWPEVCIKLSRHREAELGRPGLAANGTASRPLLGQAEARGGGRAHSSPAPPLRARQPPNCTCRLSVPPCGRNEETKAQKGQVPTKSHWGRASPGPGHHPSGFLLLRTVARSLQLPSDKSKRADLPAQQTFPCK